MFRSLCFEIPYPAAMPFSVGIRPSEQWVWLRYMFFVTKGGDREEVKVDASMIEAWSTVSMSPRCGSVGVATNGRAPRTRMATTAGRGGGVPGGERGDQEGQGKRR